LKNVSIRQMKWSSLILPALNGLAWGGLSWLGWGVMQGVFAQHVAGYPNAGQIFSYVVIPLMMVSVALVPAAFLSQTRWSFWGNVWSALALVLLLPYLFTYTGGV
jgi:hypothetical protein